MKRHNRNRADARSFAPREGEQGYVLVFLILLVALVMVSFSAIIPKMRFEAQRDREAELYFRGMQYQRAIQLYFRKFGTYPPSIEALEKSNGFRFLRKRYSDPITMKKEWRLIHVGPNGQFIDAKTSIIPPAAPGQPAGSSSPQPASTTAQPGGSNTPSQPGFGGGQPTSQSPGFGLSPSPSSFGGGGNAPGQGGLGQPGFGGNNPQNNPALTPSANPSADPQQVRGGAGGQQTQGTSTTVGGTNSNTPSSNTPSSQPGSNPSQVFGGQIAGVASLSEDSSIRVIKTYDSYDKWEFIFDYRTDPLAAAKVAATAGGQTPPPTTPPRGTPNVTPPGMFPPTTPPGSSTPPPNSFGLTPGGSPPPPTK